MLISVTSHSIPTTMAWPGCLWTQLVCVKALAGAHAPQVPPSHVRLCVTLDASHVAGFITASCSYLKNNFVFPWFISYIFRICVTPCLEPSHCAFTLQFWTNNAPCVLPCDRKGAHPDLTPKTYDICQSEKIIHFFEILFDALLFDSWKISIFFIKSFL